MLITCLKETVEDVIPLGFISEDFIFQLCNNEFIVKHSYKLKQNKNMKFDKIQYQAVSTEISNNLIRDYATNQEVFLVTAVLT